MYLRTASSFSTRLSSISMLVLRSYMYDSTLINVGSNSEWD